jgi:hypothetical protein
LREGLLFSIPKISHFAYTHTKIEEREHQGQMKRRKKRE